MVHPAGVEPAAYGIGIRHSIQLSYECKMWWEWQRLLVLFSAYQFPATKTTAFSVLKIPH